MSIKYSKCVVCGAAASNRVEPPKTLFKFISNANASNNNETIEVCWRRTVKNRSLHRMEWPGSAYIAEQYFSDQCRWWNSKNVRDIVLADDLIIVSDNCFDSFHNLFHRILHSIYAMGAAFYCPTDDYSIMTHACRYIPWSWKNCKFLMSIVSIFSFFFLMSHSAINLLRKRNVSFFYSFCQCGFLWFPPHTIRVFHLFFTWTKK